VASTEVRSDDQRSCRYSHVTRDNNLNTRHNQLYHRPPVLLFTILQQPLKNMTQKKTLSQMRNTCVNETHE